MATEGRVLYEGNFLKFTSATTYKTGEIIASPTDGRPGIVSGMGAAVASGDEVSLQVAGIARVASASATLFTIGDDVFWDISANTAITTKGVTGDLFLGTANRAKASGVLFVEVHLNPIPVANGSLQFKVQRIPISADFDNSEQSTGWLLPAKAIVYDVYLDVDTTDSSQTVDVGTDGSGSDDPDGFLDAASVNATGIVKGTVVTSTGNNSIIGTASSHTLGELLTANLIAGQDTANFGDGNFTKGVDVTSGGEEITYTGSDTTNTMRGAIVIVYLELP